MCCEPVANQLCGVRDIYRVTVATFAERVIPIDREELEPLHEHLKFETPGRVDMLDSEFFGHGGVAGAYCFDDLTVLSD